MVWIEKHPIAFAPDASPIGCAPAASRIGAALAAFQICLPPFALAAAQKGESAALRKEVSGQNRWSDWLSPDNNPDRLRSGRNRGSTALRIYCTE